MASTHDGSSSAATEDLLPTYTGPLDEPGPSASGSFRDAEASFQPESINSLNPEVAKKLAKEAQRDGRSVEDFGYLSAESATRISGLSFDDNDIPAVAPPTFADGEVRPSYAVDKTGNIVSHDISLNSSPSALLRFLRLHCSSPPSLTVQLRGTHPEQRTETTFEEHNGRRRARTHTREVEVEDFQFSIPASNLVEDGLGSARGVGGVRGCMYEVGGWEAVHRGGSWRVRERTEAGHEGAIRLHEEDDEEAAPMSRSAYYRSKWVNPSFREGRRLDREKRDRDLRGFPGFVHPACLLDMDDDHRSPELKEEYPAVLFHSHFVDLVETHASIPFGLTRLNAGPLPPAADALLLAREKRDENVRKVIESYCTSDKQLKELVVTKELYGWNLKLLEAGLRATIDLAGYRGTVQIQIVHTPEHIIIRPENWVSRIFSWPIWAKIILWLLLVYPILLLIELFVGDRYENIRVAYPLTRWRRLPLPTQTGASSSSSAPVSLVDSIGLARSLASRTPKVNHLPADKSLLYLTGVQEGEFLRSWEVAITNAVREGKRGVVLSETNQTQSFPDPRLGLRGYSA